MPLRRAQKHNHASEHIILTLSEGIEKIKTEKIRKKNQKEGEGIPDGVVQ